MSATMPHPSLRSTPSRGRDPLLGQLVADRFDVREVISRGSMGKVYLAEQHPLGRLVALKVLDVRVGAAEEDFQARFLTEASTLAKLNHPNTVRIYDFGVWEEHTWLAMEYVEGVPLSQLLRSGPVHPDLAIQVAERICASLCEAHDLGVVHRDLKPSNVLVSESADEDVIVKVIDFGLVKDLSDDKEATASGLIMGSPLYMSPEQVRGDPIDQRADIYALGVILYRALTGVPPFRGNSNANVLVAHLTKNPPPFSTLESAPTLPECVEWTVMRCLEKDPDARFADVRELKQALQVCRLALTDSAKQGVRLNLMGGHLVLPEELDDFTPSASTILRAALIAEDVEVDDEPTEPAGPFLAPQRRWPGLLMSVALGVVLGVGGTLLLRAGDTPPAEARTASVAERPVEAAPAPEPLGPTAPEPLAEPSPATVVEPTEVAEPAAVVAPPPEPVRPRTAPRSSRGSSAEAPTDTSKAGPARAEVTGAVEPRITPPDPVEPPPAEPAGEQSGSELFDPWSE
ncbi:MAG: protein kinase [Alphaproteobacteria bacterium]|nr:protein kinase [Alphaproteobacteria bacterium]